MIHSVTSVEELVYHYTTAETAYDHILRKKTLNVERAHRDRGHVLTCHFQPS